MPLDGSTEILDLHIEMFQVRRPRITVKREGLGGVKLLEQLMTRREVMALVDLCRKYSRLMAQNADVVPLSPYFDREIRTNGVTYFSPHGFIDYYITQALGQYHGCENSLEKDALTYLRFIERQHRSSHRARRKIYEQEQEFAMLLTAA
jgi:hypothetical protein